MIVLGAMLIISCRQSPNFIVSYESQVSRGLPAYQQYFFARGDVQSLDHYPFPLSSPAKLHYLVLRHAISPQFH